MNAVKILSETQDTATVSRVVWAQLLSELEDVEDRAAVVARRRREARGKQATRRNYLTAREARRLLDGESPVKVWREKRGAQRRDWRQRQA
jgi:hypothetical protein